MSGTNRSRRVFWTGNEAVVEGALAAGCSFFAGYPITPSSEVFNGLSIALPKAGGICVQMEDEIASLAAVTGASLAGRKAMTATSGPGFSLMQEGIGYAVMTETPMVIVNMMRTGPSTGQATLSGQGDFYQARYGTHGAEHEIIVLAPSTVKDCFLYTIEAFNLSERFRCPVILLGDEHVAHLRETVTLPETPAIVNRKTMGKESSPPFGFKKDPDDDNWVPPMPILGQGNRMLVTGSTHDMWGVRDTSSGHVHRKLVRRLSKKILAKQHELTRVVRTPNKNARVGLISFGSVSRAADQALAESDGNQLAHLSIGCIWPFPDEAVKEFAEDMDHILVPEMNSGMLVREVQRVLGPGKVHSYSKIGGGEPVTPRDILDIAGGLK